jgi:hypothetical protein
MTATDDDYFWDAIEIFKKSSTGQGKAAYAAREPSFIARYKALAANAITTLDQFRTIGKLKFEPMEEWGFTDLPNGPIHINQNVKSTTCLPALSSTLVHEAVHLHTKSYIGDNYVPDELVCRTLECLFYQDMASTGVAINSKVSGGLKTFKLTQVNWLGGMKEQYDYFVKAQLIDYVLNIDEYRKALKADWVEENLNYWRGPKNRWSSTLGYFVRTLAASPTPARNVLMMKLMIVVSDRGQTAWQKMIREATRPSFPAAKIKSALKDIYVKESDKAILKRRIASWGLASQPFNGLDCLP